MKSAAAVAFRDTFAFPHKEALNWFPGHMAKGLRIMQARLRSIDAILEVHDARIPFSGRNPVFRDRLSLVRPHMMLLNKMDLADLTRKQDILKKYEAEGIKEVMFSDCLHADSKAVHDIIPRITELIKSSSRFDRAVTAPTMYTIMIIGVPNVGKSSLINALRRLYLKKDNKAAAVGALPGITRTVHKGINISVNPKIQVLDTPGVAAPNVKDFHVGLKLALCHVLQEHLVGEEVLVDYMLFWMNKRRDFRYVDYFGLDGPTDSVSDFLVQLAVKRNMFIRSKQHSGGPLMERPDFLGASRFVLSVFRSGKLGKFMLDDEFLEAPNT